MSYYAGYHGVACYLSIEDFEDFMKSYFKLHPDLTEEEREDLDPAEYAFKKSDGSGDFSFFEVTADSADGMRIFPFQYENIPGKECIDLPIVDQYVVFADYQPDTLEFICNPQYHSYEDILKEFKGKLEKNIFLKIFRGMKESVDIVMLFMRNEKRRIQWIFIQFCH